MGKKNVLTRIKMVSLASMFKGCGTKLRHPTNDRVHFNQTAGHGSQMKCSLLMKKSLYFNPLQIIEVKFEKFDVERDNYCRYDHVSIFNGAEINDAKRIGKYCGDSPPA